jgi:hypothetical protein
MFFFARKLSLSLPPFLPLSPSLSTTFSHLLIVNKPLSRPLSLSPSLGASASGLPPNAGPFSDYESGPLTLPAAFLRFAADNVRAALTAS